MRKIGILLFVLLALCGLLLVSCSKDGAKDDKGADTLPTLETVGEADAIDLSGYLMIRSDSASKELKDAAVELRMAIQEKCGYLLDLKTDFGGGAALEIVIGKTKRGGTDGLNQAEFVIKHGEKGFLIAGGSDAATKAALKFFAENLLSPSGALCASTFEYKVDNSVKVGAKSYDEIKIYLGFDDDGCNSAIVEKLLAAGVPASVTDKENDANIVFTSDPDVKLATVPAGNWGVTVENDILYIVGRNEYDEVSVCKYFAEYFAAITGRFTFEEGALKTDKLESKEEFYSKTNLTIYPEFPERIGRDYMYSVSVTQGDKTATLPVYNHCQDNPRYVRNNVGGDNWRRFSMFAFSGEQVRVDVKVGRNFETYSVMPSAKNFKSEFKDGVISVWLDKPEYFVIRLDDDNNTVLSILADYPEYPLDIPSKDDPNVTWISGVVEPESGAIEITEDKQTIYIEAGAVLFARIKLQGAEGKILGRGAMVDPYENFYKFNPAGQSESKGVKFVTMYGKDCLFDGPILLDAHCYNFHIRNGGKVYNGKALSTMITTDGLQLADNCYAERCFVYVGDNGTVFGGEGAVYKDVIIGTTCAAIFPQNAANNIVMENIYVFRSDGGLINNRYNHGDNPKEQIHNIDITGLYADDCPDLPWFFQGQGMGRLDKIFNLTNVTTCSTRGVETYYNAHTGVFIRFDTTEGKLFTDNYTLNIKNLYVDGRLIKDVAALNVQTTKSNIVPHNEINITYDDTKVVTRQNADARYTNPLNIFIGDLQVFLKNPAILEGDKVYLPANEMKVLLRANGAPKTVEKNGIEYAEATELIAAAMATDFEKNGNTAVLTPAYYGDNLLLPDEGDIPNYIEATAYLVDMTAKVVDGETVYSIFNANANGAGMFRNVTDEVKMYGKGKYVLEFEICGSGNAEARFFWETSSKMTNKRQTIKLTDGWQKVTFEVDVDVDMSDLKSYTFRIAATDTTTKAFDVKNIKLTKIG